VHRCPNCGLTMDRDQNAARCILALGLAQAGLPSARGAEPSVERAAKRELLDTCDPSCPRPCRGYGEDTQAGRKGEVLSRGLGAEYGQMARKQKESMANRHKDHEFIS
jgi:hypothetical protein